MRQTLLAVIVLLIYVSTVSAQQAPATPPPVWSGNLGAGLALTNGNTDTKNINLSLGIVRDPKARSVLRVNGLYLRGTKESELTVNQTQFVVRDEINLSTKTYVFFQGAYAKDTFKGIRYLYSPTVGIGYKFINTDRLLVGLDTGVGGVWEHDDGKEPTTSGAYNIGERVQWKMSPTTTVTQSIASLWKTNDWSDSLHNFTVGLAAAITTNASVKIEILDSYKNKPSLPTLQKNDTSLITALVWKF